MKLFVSDNIFNIDNIYSYNGQLIKNILKHHFHECGIVFLLNDVNKIIDINDYLNNINDILLIHFWKQNLIELEKYKIIVCNKDHFRRYIENNNVTEINYYCQKKNIIYEDINVVKNIYLYENDFIEENEYSYFSKIYTFNNTISNEKIEFIQFQPICINSNIHQIESKTKQEYRLEKNIVNDNVVFIHIIDIDLNIIDRIIFALDKLKEKNIYTIIYLPVIYNFKIVEQLCNLKKIDNNKLLLNYYGNDITLTNSYENLNGNLSIQIECNYINEKKNYVEIHNFCNDCLTNYELKNCYINEYELNKYIYLSDLYIPITNSFTGLSIISQKYKTYTLFSDDSNNSNEYCLYGENLLKDSNDYYFNTAELKIKKNLRTNDVYENLKTFFERKEEPFFVYNKEICNILYNIEILENLMSCFDTYNTKYGKVTLYKNDNEINIKNFKKNIYWDENTLLLLKKFIDPNKNILEIGGHCGTSTLVYSSFLNDDSKIYVFEPQKKMFELLNKNIEQNNLQHKIKATNKGLFCFSGKSYMSNIDLDTGVKILETYGNDINCNYGGLTLGKDGEIIELTTMDSLDIDNIGFIHCDAQGSENFIFSNGINLIKKYKPIIYYENNELYCKNFYDEVCINYPQYEKESKFNIKKYCMEELGYRECINYFNGGMDDLLIP